MDDKVRATARLYALQNAALHGGRADPKAVLAKVMSQHPEARREARALIPAIEALVAEIDALGPDAQRALLEKEAPQLLERKGGERERPVLPPLPGAEEGKVVMRLAPYPSGPLHIGNGRMAVLNDEYAKRHKAKLLLVFDDTIGSEEKIPVLEAYDLIREGLEWLGVKVHGAPIYKSDRIPLFYDWARKLLSLGLAYVCQCPAERLRANREQGLACDHRSQTPEEGLDGFEKMLSGAYTEGTAIVRLKTDMQDRNPAFRDRVLLRIAERAHPRPEIGTKYRVWPMLEFSWAVDDHLLGITHILRGKDLVIEDQMEAFIWTKMGLPKAHFGHFGMLRIAEMKLSKSKSLKEVRSGEFEGWHDPRTWSLQSLEKRGIRPEAVRDFILSFGLSQSDIEVPAENLYTENRKLVDREANRYFFVADPVAVQATGLPEIEVEAPLHPEDPSRGTRRYSFSGEARILVASADADRIEPGRLFRLKDLGNLEAATTTRASYAGNDLGVVRQGAPILHWVPAAHAVPCTVVGVDGTASEGVVEDAVLRERPGAVVQFERVGFARLDAVGRARVRAYFAHR